MSSVSFFVFGVTLVHVDLCLHTFTHMTVTPKTKKETEDILYLMHLVAHE